MMSRRLVADVKERFESEQFSPKYCPSIHANGPVFLRPSKHKYITWQHLADAGPGRKESPLEHARLMNNRSVMIHKYLVRQVN